MASTRLTVPPLRRPAGRRRSFVNQRSKTSKLTVGAVNNVRVNLATDTKKLLLRRGGGEISLKKVETWSTVFIPEQVTPDRKSSVHQ